MIAHDDPRHGTDNAYQNHGCRCELCREAHAAYQARYRNSSEERLARSRAINNASQRRAREARQELQFVRGQLDAARREIADLRAELAARKVSR